jgi:hypothetical protein
MANYKVKKFCFKALSAVYLKYPLFWYVALGYWYPPISGGHGVIFQKNG